MTFWRATVCIAFQLKETTVFVMLIYEIHEAIILMIWSSQHRDVIVFMLFSTYERRNKRISRSFRIVCRLVTTTQFTNARSALARAVAKFSWMFGIVECMQQLTCVSFVRRWSEEGFTITISCKWKPLLTRRQLIVGITW